MGKLAALIVIGFFAVISVIGARASPVPKPDLDLMQKVVQGVGDLGRTIQDSADLDDLVHRVRDQTKDKTVIEEVSDTIQRNVKKGSEVLVGERDWDPNSPLADKDGFVYTQREIIYGVAAVGVALIIAAIILKCICGRKR